MKRRIVRFVIIVFVFSFTASSSLLLYAQSDRGGQDRGRRHEHHFQQLTEGQKAEIETLIQTMRNQGATREEIHAAVKSKFEEWGIEMPEHSKGMGKFRRIADQLTEEQLAVLQTIIDELHEQETTSKEIREAVRAQLVEWGIDIPKRDGYRSNRQIGQRGRNDIRAANHPNPFNPETTITYELERPDYVQISVYNVQGQLIRTFESGFQQAGQYQIHWDGRSDSDIAVPSGIYIYKIQAGEAFSSGRMLMMK